MNFEKFYKDNKTYIQHIDDRLNEIINIVGKLQPAKVLDIGCGSGFLINELSKTIKSKFYGIDVYPESENNPWTYKKVDITKGIPFEDSQFDCVILGEVIEHVPNPDFLLREINRVLGKDGYFIISTPNLVSWANRILVLFGIQPLYTETSSEVNLGRHFKFLGQGNKVQGHLKIFTHKSLEEILKRIGFIIKQKHGEPFFFPFPISLIDKFFTNFISLSSNLLYVAQKNSECDKMKGK